MAHTIVAFMSNVGLLPRGRPFLHVASALTHIPSQPMRQQTVVMAALDKLNVTLPLGMQCLTLSILEISDRQDDIPTRRHNFRDGKFFNHGQKRKHEYELVTYARQWTVKQVST
ncbi:hypothetical protein PILCRDRAFT_91321 [Piloderma croceum F 1598]|uniref:Uncharacterized protein n=1 Tax=Piloderma croceum (strain F 1598) TaxID=765440 RepID=A0A0C3BHX3_PILCF|nr:hypothetical protein PILCRDRAFT_91321 [Piloderma croceum F 1598]